MKPEDKCQIPRCRNESDLVYLGKGVCWKCWHKYIDLDDDSLKRILGFTPREEG
jgi:hypothetical protein